MLLQLERQIEARLHTIAKESGHTEEWHVQQALNQYLEDLEDAAIGDEAYQEYLRSGKKSYTMEEVRIACGLDD
ncbi:putative DNA-binding protein with an HTH domain [Jonquetella anthropi DSM 22815]|uniref:Putative DNA-binding protein with an HTH domain n=1 Tax=Jonquetella anthropi DSM 22815 TaxID=885272 RepID=H0ULV9_9BACT|nr:hypothetical protein [Jonquetella anthropi]EHM13600.1 putative DNA-binding protein with an HTH domain [Jonquetella anthropi DSM 22815]